jgi:large subunit ribosomal protein L29
MALSKISEARSLSDEELLEAIVEAKRELFQLRFQKATRQLEKKCISLSMPVIAWLSS